jgi:UDP-N-acetyl-D-mannosaminuronic acid dehydrogenase
LYGLTYKENVDDCRESPTLQLLKSQKRHLAAPLKVYDPLIKRDLVENQYHDLNQFLKDIDILVIMVKHDEIKEKMAMLKDKIVLDCHNICPFEGTYHL